MASLRASLLVQLPAKTAAPTLSRNGMSSVVGLQTASHSFPAVCENLGRVKELSNLGWEQEVWPCLGEAATTTGREEVMYSSSSRWRESPRNSFFIRQISNHVNGPIFEEDSIRDWQDSCTIAEKSRQFQLQQQSQSPNLFVAVVRPPLTNPPDFKPSINPFSPDVPDPNLPTPAPTTTPETPEFSPDEPPSEFPTLEPSILPEVVPSTPIEIPSTDPVPEFTPTTIPSPQIPSTPSEFPSTPSESPIPTIPTEIPLISLMPVTPYSHRDTLSWGPPEFKPMMSSDVDQLVISRLVLLQSRRCEVNDRCNSSFPELDLK